MSSFQLYAVSEDRDVQPFGPAIAHQMDGAPHVWKTLARMHRIELPDRPDDLNATYRPLWDRFGELGLDHDVLLGATFDRVWIARAHFKHFVTALQTFYVQTPSGAMGDLLFLVRRLAGTPAAGLAFRWSSAAESPWVVQEEDGEHERAYRIGRDGPGPGSLPAAWELFSRLKKPAPRPASANGMLKFS